MQSTPRTIHTLVRESIRENADRVCYQVKKDGQKDYSPVTYAEWGADLHRFSAFLVHTLDMAHGMRVGVLCDNRYEWNMISLGITSVGGVDVPRGCDATPQDILYILGHTEAPIVVVEHERMLGVLCDHLDELPHIQHIISIESPAAYRRLPELREKLGERSLYFFADVLKAGAEVLHGEGDAQIMHRGEAIQPHDLVTIIYTSGTTGAPKGVMLDHAAQCWEVQTIKENYPIGPDDRCVIFLPPWHIAERMLELTLFACGSSMANSTIVTLAQDFQRIRPTILVSVPRVWEQLYKKVLDNVQKASPVARSLFAFASSIAKQSRDARDAAMNRFAVTEAGTGVSFPRRILAALLVPGYTLLNIPAQLILKKVKNIFGGRVRFAISGAGAMPEQVGLFFRSVGIPILDGYGMTETTGVAVMSVLPWPTRGSVGRPLPGALIELRRPEDGSVVTTPGEKGVLWHHGPHVMRGYYKNPEKTAEVLKDDWLNSGDIFTWTRRGEVKFAGRAKDTIVLAGGENVEPGPIEVTLTESVFVGQCVVVGQDRKTLAALIVPRWDGARVALEREGVNAPEDPAQWDSDSGTRKFFAEIVRQQISAKNGFKTFERVTNFYLMHKEFEKGVEMTESMKIKRNIVEEMYEDRIGALYRD
ncbi:MAG: AMP-binding protein [bacterium]|nr:AMP-binding protein [bacterium]